MNHADFMDYGSTPNPDTHIDDAGMADQDTMSDMQWVVDHLGTRYVGGLLEQVVSLGTSEPPRLMTLLERAFPEPEPLPMVDPAPKKDPLGANVGRWREEKRGQQ